MKTKTLYYLFFAAILFLALKPHGGDKNSSQAPLGRTGAPGEGSCAGCHSGGSYTGTMDFQFGEDLDAGYAPGETYVLTFTGDYGAPRYGFSITVLDAGNNAVGDFSLVDEDNTSFGSTANGRQYVGHRNAGANNEWTFEWTAPAQHAGPVTFYYVINAANGDGGTGGDLIQTGSTSINPANGEDTYVLSFVVEDESGEAVPDAIITLDGNAYDAGVYVFDNLPPADYDYVVSRDGFFDSSGTAQIVDEDVTVTVVLEADETQAYTIGELITVNIFPNPATTGITIISNQEALEQVKMFDMQGRLVYEQQECGHRYTLDVSGLEAAMYLLQLKTAGQLSTHRILVQPGL